MIRLQVLNDTIMNKINLDQQLILLIFMKRGLLSSSDIHDELIKNGNDLSLITVKRQLGELKDIKLLEVSGAGRSVKYSISSFGRVMTEINSKEYCAVEPDKRYGLRDYNFNLLSNFSDNIFSMSEIQELDSATSIYKNNIRSISNTLEEKEIERFVIELSWKSSKIEGNTYTLLDTEKLISKGIEAVGHDKKEAFMILNHKEAFKVIRSNQGLFKDLTISNIEEIHKILIKDLEVSYGLRSKPVGVTGSIYRPLDNIHQIREQLDTLCKIINDLKSPYAKSLMTLLGLSYIQPFEDGNKRTSRLMANALLLSHGYAPLSYRSVDENSYREAILVFYELNSITPFKKIFIEQYIFAAKNYSVK
jgi:fido (protein-threonine AMPylation protein)